MNSLKINKANKLMDFLINKKKILERMNKKNMIY